MLFQLSNTPLKTFDIEHMYLSKNSNLFDYLINYCKKKDIQIISCLDISNNNFVINKYKMLKSLPIYFHMYNYHIGSYISKNKMNFNFL